MKPFLFCVFALQFAGTARAQLAPFPIPDSPLIPIVPIPSNEPPVDYAGAIWIPAAPKNFGLALRPSDETIDKIVVHDIEGPAASAISIFQDPKRKVSAHYIVGGDGTIYQMVREHNVGWHAGNRDINHHSIGIETEGYAYRPGWFSATIYEAEAKLVRDITRRYAIPRDRAHIIGHFEVPNPKDPTKFGGISAHTDPGPYWNWATFMTLVRNDSRLVESNIPITIRPGEIVRASVTLQNSGDDAWPVNRAPDTDEALLASGPLVALGSAPNANRISPFYSFKGWIGPSLAAFPGAPGDVLPAATARFEFSLRGPRELGEWRDTLRLTTVPTAAAGISPVAFGEKVPVALRVVPWTIDAVADPIGNRNFQAPVARWNAQLPLGGLYAVYATLPQLPKTRDFKPFVYQIETLDGPKTVALASQNAAPGPIFLGRFAFPEPSKNELSAPNSLNPTPRGVPITLQSAPRGIDANNAGLVRFIGPFPAASSWPPEADVVSVPLAAR